MNVSLLITSVWRLSQMSQSIFLVRAIVCLISQGREENEVYSQTISTLWKWSYFFNFILICLSVWVISWGSDLQYNHLLLKKVYFIFVILNYMCAFACMCVLHTAVGSLWGQRFRLPGTGGTIMSHLKMMLGTLVFGKSSKCQTLNHISSPHNHFLTKGKII